MQSLQVLFFAIRHGTRSRERSGQDIGDEDLPGLYQAADEASLTAQAQYLLAIKLYLILLIVAAVFAYIPAKGMWSGIVSAFLFLTTLGIMIWVSTTRPEDAWYNGRAVAESVKTRAWRWMMAAEPYAAADTPEIARREFIADLKQILQQNKSLGHRLGGDASIKAPISCAMEAVRSMSLQERLEFYCKHRIDDQRKWYAKKTVYNKKRAQKWFGAMIAFHALAILLLLVKIGKPDWKLPIEAIAVCASSVLSWLQVKKHRELAVSYSLAAHEITLLKAEIPQSPSEEQFSAFVLDSENAFSREHTQWVARKDK